MIPPLSPDEYKQLEENILAEGIRDPLVVWEVPNGDMILLDGHNRFEISARHGGIHFEVKKMRFSGNDREQAKAWMLKNQLGRRNLNHLDAIALARQLEQLKRDEAKERQGTRTDKGNIVQKSARSRDELAALAGVSHDTYKKGVEILESGNQKLIDNVRSGQQSINSAWLEIKERERKQEDLSAKAHLEKAKDRHEDFQSAKTVTMSDIAQDRKDSAEIASGKSREITNALKGILFIGAAMSSGDADYSIINQKNMSTEEIRTLTNKITQAISILTSIRESIGR